MKLRELFEDMKCFVRKNVFWIVFFLCLVGFLSLAEDVFHREIMKGDIVGYDLLSRYFISDFFTPVAKVITNFGGAYFIIFCTFILVFVLKKTKWIIANLAIVTAINQFLKQVLQRPRPTDYRIVDASGYSFPSGHSMVSMAFYGYLIYLIYMNEKQSLWKWTGIILLGTLILMIGVSRIYLGVHYTSDVVAGFLISISYLIVFIQTTNGFSQNKEDL